MIKTKKQTKQTIDLTGPEGNAFVLIGYAKKLSRQLELDFDQVHREMTSNDYEHLVKVFDDYFGDYVDLVR
jgi:hypothetical protein